MNLTSGYPYSLVRYGLPFNYPALNNDLSTDVVIVGGGISGALMAHYLMKDGVNTMVLDERTIGLGSTCASTSLLQYEIDTPLSELQKKIGKQEAITAYKLCAEAIDKLTGIAGEIGLEDFEKKESLYYAHRKKDDAFLKKEFEIRKESGFDVQLLDQTEIMKTFNFNTSSGILSAKAAQTNAYSFTHTLLQYNIKKGLNVYDRTRAEKIIYSKANVVIKTNTGHTIKARKLIFANGYEAIHYIDKKIVNLDSTYVVCSEQMNRKTIINTDALLWSTGHPYLYMRTTLDNRILIGGKDEPFYNPEKRDKLIEKKSAELCREFLKLFPTAVFKPEFNWAGTFGTTKDGLPFIGQYKKMYNSYFALGYGGNGITFSLIAAEILSNELKGYKSNLKIFSFDRV